MPIDATPPPAATLRQLQYVVAVAAERNFSRAAERCAVSQPSLSAQVAEVEDALGVRLFERQRSGVLVTPAGVEVVERARRILLEIQDLEQAARRHLDPLAGRFRVGIIPTLAPYLLPAAAPALHAAFPRLEAIWIEEKTGALVELLGDGKLDAMLIALESDIGDVECEVVGRDPFVLATPPDHPLGKAKGRLRPDQLEGERVLLLAEGHCFRDQALAVCSAAQEPAFRATSLPTLVQMVAAGLGVTLLPSIAVATEAAHAAVRIRTFAAPAPFRTLVMAWRKSAPADAHRAIAAAIRRTLPR